MGLYVSSVECVSCESLCSAGMSAGGVSSAWYHSTPFFFSAVGNSTDRVGLSICPLVSRISRGEECVLVWLCRETSEECREPSKPLNAFFNKIRGFCIFWLEVADMLRILVFKAATSVRLRLEGVLTSETSICWKCRLCMRRIRACAKLDSCSTK